MISYLVTTFLFFCTLVACGACLTFGAFIMCKALGWVPVNLTIITNLNAERPDE